MMSTMKQMEIVISGGRPWGFSIKGGQENNKPLVISKLEKGGKAESYGLLVGDVLHCVNDIHLSGMRNEAIHLVKRSGYTLSLDIERRIKRKQEDMYNPPLQDSEAHNFSPLPVQEELYFDESTQTTLQLHDNDQSFATKGDVFLLNQGRYYNDASVFSSTVYEETQKPLDGADCKEDYSSTGLVSNLGIEDPFENKSVSNKAIDAIPQPKVNLRARKARDKGISIERPRSWHASKQSVDPDFVIEERSMRSPVGGYLGSPHSQSRSYYQKTLGQPCRRSKGWFESEDLKSVYKGDINSSKDSLISGSSQRSFRSEKLSVSSSRSSGAMSSSRGSLENLIDINYSSHLENYPQVFVLSNSEKQKPSAKPQCGIVSQQKNLFEKLSQKSSQDKDGQDNNRNFKDTLPSYDKAETEIKGQPHLRESSKGTSQCGNKNNRCSSLSPPLTLCNVSSVQRKRCHDSDGGSSNSSSQRYEVQPICSPYKDKTDPSPSNPLSTLTTSDVKAVKPVNQSSENPQQNSIPDPPQRDNSSIQAVRNYHSRSQSGSTPDDNAIPHCTASGNLSLPGKSSPKRQSPISPPRSALPSPLPHKLNIAHPSGRGDSFRHERMFGVMSVGNDKNIVAASVTVLSTNKNDTTKTNNDTESKSSILVSSDLLPERSRQVVESQSSDRISHKTNTINVHPNQSSSARKVFEHSKSSSGETSDSAESKAKGKYGLVWNTPQNSHKTHVQNFTAHKDWKHTNEGSAHLSKVALLKKANEIKDNKQSELNNNASTNSADVQVDSLPLVLRSLQNTQHGTRKYKNFEPKSPSDAHEKVWFTETTPALEKSAGKLSPEKSFVSSPNENYSANYKNWEVDLDERVDDDAFAPQHRYCDDIKDMSRKVLRVTSFTRKDLEVSPSLRTFEEKKRLFQSSKLSNKKQAHPAATSRSRSHDSDDESLVSVFSGSNNDSSLSRSNKSRPKSAGVVRSNSSRHTPVLRTNVAPSCRPTSYYARNCESLPRNVLPSYTSNTSTSPSSPSPKRRTGVEVQGESETVASGHRERKKSDTRTAVLNFISRKTGRSFDSGELDHSTSFTSLHTSHSDETDNRRSKEKKLLNENQFCNPGRLNKSTRPSSFMEEDSIENESRGSSMAFAEKSTSVDNLTDSGLDMSRASPTGISDSLASTKEVRTKTNEIAQCFESPVQSTFIQAPARKYVKHHRQRHSNSSSASSATTISTLSSFSSSSSTSMGRFPALGEEAERLSPPTELLSECKTPPEKQATHSPSATKTSPSPCKSASAVARTPIDTGTYRVAKRKNISKCAAKPNVEENRETSYKSTKEIILSTPKISADLPSNVSELLLLPHLPTPFVKPTYSTTSPEEQEKVNKIIEKVKRSSSFHDTKLKGAAVKNLPLPPPPSSLDDASERLLSKLVQERYNQDLPPPPSELLNETRSSSNSTFQSSQDMRPNSGMASGTSLASMESHNGLAIDKDQTPADLNPPSGHHLSTNDNNKETSLQSSCGSDHINGASSPCENVFKPIQPPSSGHPQSSTVDPTTPTHNFKNNNKSSLNLISEDNDSNLKETSPTKQPPEISPEPLLDILLLSKPTSLQEEHPDLTRDIIKVDQALAQVLTTSNKKALDYMAGVFPRPSHNIVEEGMRYRRRRPTSEKVTLHGKLFNDSLPSLSDPSCRDNLPASSTYYKTSASKAKILNMAKEKIAEGELPNENLDTLEDINRKKMELILSIKGKLDDLQSMKSFLDVEMKENECLGKQVHDLTKSVCTKREQEKYNIFVQDVDKIINLLLSLSGRLARVENAIQMLPADADKQEMNLLCKKRKKLTEQHNEAKLLKENIDRRQKIVSEILASYLDHEQFADYEHYIKMKSALIMEQRELEDKRKLGQEQIQCLRDTLPDDWQINLDSMLEE